MLYQRRSFTVPAGAGTGEMCRTKGHSAADSRGHCLCCGAQIVRTADEPATSTDSQADEPTVDRCFDFDVDHG
jgi:hypothetical protein